MKRTFLFLFAVTLVSLPAMARVSVTPKEHNGWKDALLMSNGSAEVVIVPSIGRVMQFRFVGEEGVFWENPAVAGKPVNPLAKDWINFGGDKPWPAPQADWPKITPRAWPPPIGFDASAWEAKINGETVELTSPVDPHYGIRAIRRIKLDPTQPVMTITTVFEKVKGEPRNVAVWVITQLKDPDMVLVPVPKDSQNAEGFQKQSKELPAHFRVQNNTISLKRDPSKSTKIGTDASMLIWVGAKHALRIEARRVPNAVYPDQGSSAEVYTNVDPLRYVELEMLGPLREMKIGDKIDHTNLYTLLPRSRIRSLKDF
jgi:Domain of unknown function (DUF4380)